MLRRDPDKLSLDIWSDRTPSPKRRPLLHRISCGPLITWITLSNHNSGVASRKQIVAERSWRFTVGRAELWPEESKPLVLSHFPVVPSPS
jgi:hypothetical protein